MKEDLYIQLIHKQLSKDISPSETAQLNDWLKAEAEHRNIYAALQTAWKESENLNLNIDLDLDEEFKQLSDRLELPKAADNEQASIRPMPKPSATRRSWLLAAAGLLILIAGTFWLRNNFSTIEGQQIMVTNLSHATKKVSLPDGSTVYLNESSAISYPEKFTGDRKIRLTGEAFFQIEHNAKQPFIVNTSNGHEVKVLGTEFTVRENESHCLVNVTQGKVQFSASSNSQLQILTKGMEAKANHITGELVVDINATANADFWRTKTLRYESQELQKVILELADIFGVQFSPLPSSLSSCTFNSTFPNAKLSDIIQEIATVYGAEVIQNDKEPITFSGGECQ